MRVSAIVCITIGLLLGSVASYAAVTRVDVNGELVNPITTALGPTTPSLDPANAPTGWNVYHTINGDGDPLGAVGFNYFNGAVSSGLSIGKYCNAYEVSDGNSYTPPATAPTTGSGHSVALGMSTVNAGASSYGISQTFNATAGKLYWLNGEQTYAGYTGYKFSYGLQDGYATDGGRLEKNNVSNTYMQNGGRFFQAVVAQNSGPMTVHVGQTYDGVSNPAWFIDYVDSVRVYEMDIPVYNSLQNGGFDSVDTANVTNFGNAMDQMLWSGWTPLGGCAGKYDYYRQGTGSDGTANSNAYMFMRGGSGRMMLLQRVNKGAGLYNVSGQMMLRTAADAAALINAQIGIDPTGGLDPNAASVVWTTAMNVKDGLWHNGNLSVNAGANGITIFLAGGDDTDSVATLNYYDAQFDNIQLSFTAVPEPGSLLALGAGLLSLVGVIRRRR